MKDARGASGVISRRQGTGRRSLRAGSPLFHRGTDEVFAIVITILVLGIEAPSSLDVSTAQLREIRGQALHQLWVYFVSFCIVRSYWIQHTVLFGSLRSIDRPITVLNLLYLLPVTLLPFVTQVMGAEEPAYQWVNTDKCDPVCQQGSEGTNC